MHLNEKQNCDMFLPNSSGSSDQQKRKTTPNNMLSCTQARRTSVATAAGGGSSVAFVSFSFFYCFGCHTRHHCVVVVDGYDGTGIGTKCTSIFSCSNEIVNYAGLHCVDIGGATNTPITPTATVVPTN